MQKRKIEDNAIWDAYKRIISGESLTAVATEIGLNRGTLRRYIAAVVEPDLNEEEKIKFDEIINKNFRGNSTENKRQNRNGVRKRAAEQIESSEEIKELAEYGVTPEQIEYLYNRLKEDKRTTFAKDTYIYKYLEHLRVLGSLGFSAQEAFDIFVRRPKLFTGSAGKMSEIFMMHLREQGNEMLAKQKMIADPWADLRKKKEVSDGGDGR